MSEIKNCLDLCLTRYLCLEVSSGKVLVVLSRFKKMSGTNGPNKIWFNRFACRDILECLTRWSFYNHKKYHHPSILTFSPWKRHGKCPPTFLQRQPNSFSSHSIYVKDNFYLIFSSKKVWYQKIILLDFISKFPIKYFLY